MSVINKKNRGECGSEGTGGCLFTPGDRSSNVACENYIDFINDTQDFHFFYYCENKYLRGLHKDFP